MFALGHEMVCKYNMGSIANMSHEGDGTGYFSKKDRIKLCFAKELY